MSEGKRRKKRTIVDAILLTPIPPRHGKDVFGAIMRKAMMRLLLEPTGDVDPPDSIVISDKKKNQWDKLWRKMKRPQ